ncbi:hypothetical protein ACFLSE_06675 [Bacteroidota bacterium]
MKTIFLLFVVSFLSLNAFSQTQKESDLERWSLLKGKVKSARTTPYKASMTDGVITKGRISNEYNHMYRLFNEDGNFIETIYYKYDGGMKKKTTYNYDESGKLVEYKEYNYEYNPQGRLASRWEIKYDSTNKKTRTDQHADGMLYQSTRYIYNKYGKLIYEGTYDHLRREFSQISTNTYDDNGNLIIEKSAGSDGDIYIFRSYKYNKEGEKIVDNAHRKDSSISMSTIYDGYDEKRGVSTYRKYKNVNTYLTKHEYKSNEKGTFKYEVEYDPDGNITRVTVSQCDDYDNRTGIQTFYNNESCNISIDENYVVSFMYLDDAYDFVTETVDDYKTKVLRENYKYEYDEKNNWIKKTRFIKTTPQEITERQIEYYD